MSLKSSARVLTPELPFDAQYEAPLCGIDEVGRGPLAGPVVAACAFIPPEVMDHPVWAEINDSKKLSAKKRETLFDQITEMAHFGIAEASAQEIDDLNIHHATLLAMKRAYTKMLDDFKTRPQTALIDGRFVPDIPCPGHAIIKGDGLSLSIGTASIIAKVYRDRLMAALHEAHPYYGWDHNAGYGTAVHMEGIELRGITEHHRKSFGPCREKIVAA